MGSRVAYFADVAADANFATQWNAFYESVGWAAKAFETSSRNWTTLHEGDEAWDNESAWGASWPRVPAGCDYCFKARN